MWKTHSTFVKWMDVQWLHTFWSFCFKKLFLKFVYYERDKKNLNILINVKKIGIFFKIMNVKVLYPKKATKIWKISQVFLTFLSHVRWNFLAYSDYMNFNNQQFNFIPLCLGGLHETIYSFIKVVITTNHSQSFACWTYFENSWRDAAFLLIFSFCCFTAKN